jgi:prevent-host-death family protein
MTITATQFKQQTYLLDSAIKEDIHVTKRDRPFVVIVDVQKYEALLANQKEQKRDTSIDDTLMINQDD